MPFLILYKNSNKKVMNNKYTGKEKDSDLAHHLPYFFNTQRERVSVFTSKASMTLEAALAAPIFLFAVLSIIYLLELMSMQTTVRAAMHSAGKEIARESYRNSLPLAELLEEKLVETIGEQRLENSLIKNGSTGFDCSASKTWWQASVMDLSVRYQVEIPIAMFRIPIICREEMLRVKKWTGYYGDVLGNSNEKIVYITDTGIVYHEDAHCTHLDLSIQCVSQEELSDRRNQLGGKYYACARCSEKNPVSGKVYITDIGERYHTSLSCSGLKRSVYAVPVSEVYGRSGCSRCVQ